jgi:hypothetical protein
MKLSWSRLEKMTFRIPMIWELRKLTSSQSLLIESKVMQRVSVGICVMFGRVGCAKSLVAKIVEVLRSIPSSSAIISALDLFAEEEIRVVA